MSDAQSLAHLQDGVISLPKSEIKIQPSSTYQGLYIQNTSNLHNKNYSWMSQMQYSQVFKFPIATHKNLSTKHLPKESSHLTFSKCCEAVKESINIIHLSSPFKTGMLTAKPQQSAPQQQVNFQKRKTMFKSYQSENVQDTIDEESRACDQVIQHFKEKPLDNKLAEQTVDNSLNKSHLTFEDNNKASKLSKKIPNNSPVEEEVKIPEKELSQNNNQNQVEKNFNSNAKVFELREDDFHYETSFDSMIVDNLFITHSEEILTTQNQQNQQNKEQKGQETSSDDQYIEKELNKINSNLNSFTVEHFNTLRQQIQTSGFQHAAHKAKREFNLLSTESMSSLMTMKEEDEITNTEENKMQDQFHGRYAQNTLASKNILHVKQSESSKNLPRNLQIVDTSVLPPGLSPLIRKLVVCEIKNLRNHSIIEVMHSCSCSGFNSSPLLEFSEEEDQSKAFLDKTQTSQLILTQLLTSQILKSFICTPVTWVTCGYEHCVVLTIYGTVASWGYGASGCLGHGNYVSYTSPKLLQNGPIASQFITYVESGGYHNAAISSEGVLYTWGRADVGQIGHKKNSLLLDEMGFVSTLPQPVEFFEEKKLKISQVALGEAHTLALDDRGQVYSFGWSQLGQLGIPGKTGKESDFQINQVPLFDTFPCCKVSAGAVFSIALTAHSGKVYAWGSGQNGQLGLGNVKFTDHPTLVEYLDAETIIDVQCGDSHTMALSSKGIAYGWGQGISRSKNLIQNIKYSSFSSQNSDKGQQQQIYPDSLNQQEMEVICFYPRILGDVDILHNFLVSDEVQSSVNTNELMTTNMLDKRRQPSEITDSEPDLDAKFRQLKKKDVKSNLIMDQKTKFKPNTKLIESKSQSKNVIEMVKRQTNKPELLNQPRNQTPSIEVPALKTPAHSIAQLNYNSQTNLVRKEEIVKVDHKIQQYQSNVSKSIKSKQHESGASSMLQLSNTQTMKASLMGDSVEQKMMDKGQSIKSLGMKSNKSKIEQIEKMIQQELQFLQNQNNRSHLQYQSEIEPNRVKTKLSQYTNNDFNLSTSIRSHNYSRISMKDQSMRKSTQVQRVRSPQPELAQTAKLKSGTPSNTNQTHHKKSNTSKINHEQTNSTVNSNANSPSRLGQLPQTTRNKAVEPKLQQMRSLKKTKFPSGNQTQNLQNLGDTSRLSNKTNKNGNGTQLISPTKKAGHKKNKSAFNCTDSYTNPIKGRGPKIGMEGSGQQSRLEGTLTKISPRMK